MKDLLYLKDDQIKDFIEQIFYAYRETYSDPKKILKKYSFGTAHHRAIHIIERHKGITISGLLNKLKITKQSLNRVLRDLIKNKSVLIKKGEIDSRQRHIFLNEKGQKLFDEIFLEQKKRIYNALKNSDSDSVIKFKNVLVKLLMNKNIFHILVVDDDNRIRELVKEYLEENHFLVTTAKDALDAKKKIEMVKFDILILDIMMPGESGLSLTKEIKKNNTTPIILLTAKGETQDRIEGLELGADDYLGKPFEPKELLLRIKNILNKTQVPVLPEEIYIGDVLINLKKLSIKINNQTKKINPQEEKVLEKMLRSPGKVFSRDDIGKIINISKERTIDVMITRLRQKIESNPKNPKYLQTIRGSGYVLWIE